MDHQAQAEAIFGTAGQTAAPKPAATASDQLAEALYGDTGAYKSPFEPTQGQQQEPAPKTQAKQEDKPAEAEQVKPEIAAQAAELAGALAAEIGLAEDHPDTASFSALAAEIGLPPESAVKLAKWDQERNAVAWDRTAEVWLAEAQADPLFDTNVTYGRALLAEFGNPRIAADINNLALGSHPGLIQLLGNIGRSLERARRSGR